MTAGLDATATCTAEGCDWSMRGTMAEADRAAQRHGKDTGHPTLMQAVPAGGAR